MGTWGTKIFQDDLAKDIKNTYIDLLKQGIDNEKATKNLINDYVDNLDEDEISIFWFALADVQWDYGRLINQVKEKALYYLNIGIDLERWKEEATEKEYIKRKEVLENLEKKLKSEMPKEKKITIYKNYICPWHEGDVYACPINEGKYVGNYIVFIKVSEGNYYPHNICPLVYVYKKIFKEIPKIEELKVIPYLPQFYLPNAYKGKYENVLYKCQIGIKNSTKKLIEKYIYVGNLKKYDLPQNEKNDIHYSNNNFLSPINMFLNDQIKNYEAWKDVEL